MSRLAVLVCICLAGCSLRPVNLITTRSVTLVKRNLDDLGLQIVVYADEGNTTIHGKVTKRGRKLEELVGCLNISLKSETQETIAFVKGGFRKLPRWEDGSHRPRPLGFHAEFPLVPPKNAILEVVYHDACD